MKTYQVTLTMRVDAEDDEDAIWQFRDATSTMGPGDFDVEEVTRLPEKGYYK